MDEGQSVIEVLVECITILLCFQISKSVFPSTHVTQLSGPVTTIITLVNARNSKAEEERLQR